MFQCIVMQHKNERELPEECYLRWCKAIQVTCELFDLHVPLQPRAGTEPTVAVLA